MVFFIGEKLDLLMKVTDTKNSVLGRALNFDASYISRIRAGKRGVPKHQPFIDGAAAFFAARLTEPYQRKMAAELLRPGGPLPESGKELAGLIAAWLSETEDDGELGVKLFLSGVAAPPVTPPELVTPPPLVPNAAAGSAEFYYGNQGKREAVERFLLGLCETGVPHTLLLWSNEDMDWMEEDREFIRRWAALMFRLLTSGSRVHIIHTISRDMSEMLSAIGKWLPLYATGAIEAWYCPLPMDNLARRSLFVAKGYSAVISDSVKHQTRDMLNLLLRDSSAVAALEQEFENYRRLCHQLMEVYVPSDNPRRQARFRAAWQRSLATPGSLLRAGNLPSLATLPPETAEAVAARSGNELLPELRRELAEDLEKRLAEGNQVTEILCLPPPEALVDAPLPLMDLFGAPPCSCTRKELAAHLRAALDLARREKGYRVVLSGGPPGKLLLRAGERDAVAVARTEPPGVLFQIREERLAGSLREYLKRLLRAGTGGRAALEAYLARLESENETVR